MASRRTIAQQLVERLDVLFPGQLNVSGIESVGEKLCFKCSFDRQYGSNTLYVYVDAQCISWRIVNTNDVHEQPLDGGDPVGEAAEAITGILQGWAGS